MRRGGLPKGSAPLHFLRLHDRSSPRIDRSSGRAYPASNSLRNLRHMKGTRMARKESSPLKELVFSLLTGWIWALPFALFFSLVMGGFRQFLGVYQVSV